MAVLVGPARTHWLPRPASPLRDSLVAYWRLDEESGIAIDATRRGNDLTDNNTVTNAAGLTSRFARQYTAANSERHSIADNADVSMGDIDFTIAAAVNLDTTNAARYIVAKDAAGTTRDYGLFADWDGNNNLFRFSVFNGVSTQIGNVNRFVALTAATWYTVFAWHDAANNQVGIAVNGEDPATAARTGAAGKSTAGFVIGARSDGVVFWNGRIAFVGLWKRILTAGERALVYNGGSGLTFTGNGFVPRLGWGGRS